MPEKSLVKSPTRKPNIPSAEIRSQRRGRIHGLNAWGYDVHSPGTTYRHTWYGNIVEDEYLDVDRF
jgi:hypothetical protein